MTFTPDTALAVAAHELGHGVVAAWSGARLDRVELVLGGRRTAPTAAIGLCRYSSESFATDEAERAICAAGTAAEAVYRHGPRPTSAQLWHLLTTKNTRDYRALTQLCHARGQNPMGALTEVLPLVLANWTQIATLAAQLHRDGEVGSADVSAALGMTPAARAA